MESNVYFAVSVILETNFVPTVNDCYCLQNVITALGRHIDMDAFVRFGPGWTARALLMLV